MSAVVLQRSSADPPSSNYAGGAGDPTEVAFVRMKAGECVVPRLRYAEAYINGTTAPSTIFWEGPYLRIRPFANFQADRGVGGARYLSGEPIIRQSTGTRFTQLLANLQAPQADSGFFYEIDANAGVPIYAPWDCEVSLVTGLSGIWAFDYQLYGAGILGSSQDSARLYSHTRWVYGNGAPASRTFSVPIGAIEAQIVGYNDINSTPSLEAETVAKAAGLGTSIGNVFTTSGNCTVGRFSLGNAVRVTHRTGGATGIASGITFWCKVA